MTLTVKPCHDCSRPVAEGERCIFCGTIDTRTMADPVNHPPHYTGEVECIDAIESALGREQFIGYLRGQILKYTWRCGKKDDSKQDSDKAGWYQRKLSEVLKK